MSARILASYLLFILLSGCILSTTEFTETSQTPIATLYLPVSTEPISIHPSRTPTDADTAMYPTLDPSTVSGKIVFRNYTDGKGGFILMNSDGTKEERIDITNESGVFDVLSTPMRWSPNGRYLAFGCQNKNAETYGLCILNLEEYFSGASSSRFLSILLLPEQFLREYHYGPRLVIQTLEWFADSRRIVINSDESGLCILDISQPQAGCNDGLLSGFDSADQWTINHAYTVLPMQEDNVWLLFSRREGEDGMGVYKVFWEEKKVIRLNLGKCLSFNMRLSNDGNKLATDYGIVNLVNMTCHEFPKTIDMIALNLLPDLEWPGQDHYISLSDGGYPPRQSISWSPDGRYLAITVYYESTLRDDGFNDNAGVFYYDTQTGSLLPIKVEFTSGGVADTFYATPNWYACNDSENVCDLYK